MEEIQAQEQQQLQNGGVVLGYANGGLVHILARFAEERPKIDDDNNNNNDVEKSNSRAIAKNNIYNAATAGATRTFTATSTSLVASSAQATYEAVETRTVNDLLITKAVRRRRAASVENAALESGADTTKPTNMHAPHTLATHLATQQKQQAQPEAPQQQAALSAQLSIAMFAQIL